LAPLRWFTVNVDTTGLAPGTYGVTLSSPNASFRNSMNRPVAARANLSFTVTAIPEPSSVVALMLIGGTGCLVHRKRRR
ncbi:PEP-CTERM sorting domain-containing protein, partial [Rubripirellula tenax]|uniref:PEP-CTERM sorting domain-containing protein n=1 Tax=Rubripirellula tenax TaxID=2528015 RepID=UPI0011B80C7A